MVIHTYCPFIFCDHFNARVEPLLKLSVIVLIYSCVFFFRATGSYRKNSVLQRSKT